MVIQYWNALAWLYSFKPIMIFITKIVVGVIKTYNWWESVPKNIIYFWELETNLYQINIWLLAIIFTHHISFCIISKILRKRLILVSQNRFELYSKIFCNKNKSLRTIMTPTWSLLFLEHLKIYNDLKEQLTKWKY